MKPALEMKVRKAERRRCSISSMLTYFSQKVECRVVDVSETGIAVDVKQPVAASVGSKVTVENHDFGLLTGTVRWNHNGRIGIEFIRDTNCVAKMAQYFRHFHQEYKPVVSR
jgi:PilZ domain.